MPAAVESMFSVREVPWHGLGTIVQDAPDSERALILAGLAWGVEKRPLYVQHDNQPILVPGYVANVRATDGRTLGIVGGRYTVLQNREAFQFMDGLLGDGARYETAGALQEGKRVWMLARLPEVYRAADDDTTAYVLVSNSHDGSGAVRAAIVPVRVVCQNTLNLALARAKRSWTCRHVGSVQDKLTEAQRTLGLARDYMKELTNAADVLAAMKVSRSDWDQMVKELIPAPEGDDIKPAVMQRVEERQELLRGRILVSDLANYRVGGQYTGYGVVGAVSDFITHAEPSRKVSGWQERRFERVVEGDPMLDKALDMLRDMAGR
ncbi:MAG: DUF932 domain-containing protein [Dehalococcoidia bacterium]|nr:DUF932 domain-containing protein [Dehalococcoidia bacterium]